jgi:type IV secretory pathway ATPase VirB11/archaellum biosynthesis ATPase
MFQLGKSKKPKDLPKEMEPCSSTSDTVHGKPVMFISCKDCLASASLSNSKCREGVLRAMAQDSREADRLVLRKPFQKVYGKETVKTLRELAAALKEVSGKKLCPECQKMWARLWQDPLYVYYKLIESRCGKCEEAKAEVLERLDRTSFIEKAVKIGNKDEAYLRMFKPLLIPEVISSHVRTKPPEEKTLAGYSIGDVEIGIYPSNSRIDLYYFVKFPELNLSQDEVDMLDKAFEKLIGHKPEINFSPEMVRGEFRRIITDIVSGLSQGKKVDKAKMVEILYRHTVGYGIIEPILADEHVQDMFVDSGSSVVHIVHSEFGECVTNISMSRDEIEKLATRLRAASGRPFDASTPVLHAELEDFGVRVCGVCEPSTYRGTGFAFRRRKKKPWTLSEFVSANMIDSRTAGMLSFLVDSQNSFLVTGPRSSGKTSLLTALLLEIPQNMRIILIEDTPEIPVQAMKELGFKIEHLKTEAFAKGFELSTEDALRTSLRLGDSVLVIGEVRGPEAKALFEAMRIGAAGNVVLGTIHGSGVHDTWDRVVNDLGVPTTSFKAVDLVLSAGTIRSGESVRRYRRLLQVAEVLPGWTKEPKFHDLVSYKRGPDSWKVSASGSHKLAKAANTKGMSQRAVQDNIAVRSKMKQVLAELAKKENRPELMGPEMTVASNNQFLKLSSDAKSYLEVYKKWLAWLKKEI